MKAISASATLRTVLTTGLALICSLGAAAASPPLPKTVSTTLARPGRLIAGGLAGAVRIGMTVAQARLAAHPLTLRRTSDGEGVALIGVMRGQGNGHDALRRGGGSLASNQRASQNRVD